MITTPEIQQLIQEDINREERYITIHNTIREVIKAKWEGKKYNKRFADQVKERLTVILGEEPSVTFNYGMHEWSSSELVIWGLSGLAWHNRMVVYLGKGREGTVEGFERDDARHGSAAEERNSKRKALLADSTTLQAIVNQVGLVREQWSVLQSMLKGPADQIRYTIEERTGLKKEYGRYAIPDAE